MAAFDGCTAHARRSDEIKALIKTTTSDMMIAPDWGANMTLVDLVNGTHNAKVRISASPCARACASRCASRLAASPFWCCGSLPRTFGCPRHPPRRARSRECCGSNDRTMLLVTLLTHAHAHATHARPQILSVTIELFRKRLQTKALATVPVTLTVVEVRLSPPSPPGYRVVALPRSGG
jgi:hypothetical protein